MLPLIIPFAANLAGTIFQYEGNKAKAKAQKKALQAQAFLQEAQATEQLRQTEKQVDISKKKAKVIFGDQVSAFAKAGVQLSDSALLVLANTKSELEQEGVEIQRQGSENARLIRLGAAQLRQEAKDIGRSLPNIQAGTILSGIGSTLKDLTVSKG
jgi:hypothetical protein